MPRVVDRHAEGLESASRTATRSDNDEEEEKDDEDDEDEDDGDVVLVRPLDYASISETLGYRRIVARAPSPTRRPRRWRTGERAHLDALAASFAPKFAHLLALTRGRL